jgi:hypothetical protein
MGAMVTFFNREIPSSIRSAYQEEQAKVKSDNKTALQVPVAKAKDSGTP